MRLPRSVSCVCAHDLTNQNGGLPTSLMVNAPPNNCLKDYSLQQINNGNNRRLSTSCTESIKQGKKKKKEKSWVCVCVCVCVCVWAGGGGGVAGGRGSTLT